jgi:hypothetical protein
MRKWTTAIIAALAIAVLVHYAHRPRETGRFLKPIPVEQNLSVRSFYGEPAATIIFSNTTEGPIQLVWLDYEGRHVPRDIVPPHAAITEATAATNFWLCLDEKGNDAALFMARPGIWTAAIHR